MEKTALIIGNLYLVPDSDGTEVEGTLESGAVLENEKSAYCTYLLKNGKRIIATTPLTDSELKRYKENPDMFFGALQPVPKQVKDYKELYNFFHSTYSKSKKEQLLEFMASHPEINKLKELSQQELARFYCESLVSQEMR